MYKNKAILCIIPARGGSKGLPGKNIMEIAGKPLIGWTIEQALACKYIDTVIVSTDDDEIAEISKSFGAEVPFKRPEELARDGSPTMDTVFHAIDYFENNARFFDILVLLEPTSPLRKRNDLDDAIESLVDSEANADSIVSVGEVHLENPHITKMIVNGYVTPLIESKTEAIFQRQQLPKIYFPYGVIYAGKVSELKEEKTFYQKRTIPYFIERWQNYEIDDIFDSICVEAIINYKNKETE